MAWSDWIQAGLAAYGGYQSAQAANKPRDSRTDQTTTNRPYAEPLIAGDIEAALDYQRQLMAGGPRYVGTGPGGGGRTNTSGAAPTRRGSAQTWTNARGQQMTLDSRGRAVPATGSSAPVAPGGAATSTAPRGIQDISNEVARRGLEAGNDPTVNAARRATERMLEPTGGSGFGGYNPINDYLAGELRGDVESREAARLLREFIGDDFGDNAGGGFRAGSGRVSYGAPAYVQQMQGGSGASGGNGGVPDTVGGSNSYFAQQIRDLMNTQTNDADLQAIIDAQNADVLRGMQSDQWALDAQAQGAGRFGGDTWAALANQARADATREMGTNASRARLAEQENRRALYANLLGQVNTRDLGAMQDATQRYGIDASARAAGAGSADAASATRRAQNLQALQLLLGHDEFNVGALGGLGEQLSSDRLNAIGLTPDLAGVGLSGLGAANQSVGNLVGSEGNATSLRNAQIAAGTARAGLNQQAQLYNSQLPWNMTNDYLRNIGLVAGLGGTSTTTGTNVVGGVGANPWATALMAGGAAYYGNR